jgi:hypothetical protein
VGGTMAEGQLNEFPVWLAGMKQYIERLMAGTWTDLHGPDALRGRDLSDPGVYVIAYSGRDLGGLSIDPEDVLYVGMSNNGNGVQDRLHQFMQGLEGTGKHSGARRMYRDYHGGRPYSQMATSGRIFFAAVTLPCNSHKRTATADDYRAMGEVANLEYAVIAHLMERTGRKPELNQF